MDAEMAVNTPVLLDAARVPISAGGDDGFSEPGVHGDGGFSESGESEEDLGAGRGGRSPAWLQHVLRSMAEAHRDMAMKAVGGGGREAELGLCSN